MWKHPLLRLDGLRTIGHGYQCGGQVGLVRVGAGSPFEDEVGGLVSQEVHDCEVDIELLGLFMLHAAGQGIETGGGVSAMGCVGSEDLLQLFLVVYHVLVHG